ncbi:MAG: GTP-binding protein LepA [Parcubacteria group bacterium Gr01-1014_72]|nr:MAG: GTP-binding protein LepA [Parcubacteria group bacterium Gr01-1014_72]
MKNIRNFCIIAHVDHGKSTLADRMLQITGTIPERKMRDQVLDSMDLERERGITIKMTPVRMNYQLPTTNYQLNLIDTPGHIDFAYEVSRALRAVEGCVFLVDATQGVQAQTITTLSMAREAGLTILPAVSKVDSPLARIAEVKEEVSSLVGCLPEEVLEVSGKTGQGVAELLGAIVSRVPSPRSERGGSTFRALIFDFRYDNHTGVVLHFRVFDGSVAARDELLFSTSGRTFTPLEVGVFVPEERRAERLGAGEIGYIVSGVKEPGIAVVGDTVTLRRSPLPALHRYERPRPVVWAGLYPESHDDFDLLRQALSRLRLSDSSFTHEEDSSGLLGRGFRCGFLGMLHMEIITERLRREHGIRLIVTAPSITYEVVDTRGVRKSTHSPSQFPEHGEIAEVFEPWVRVEIITPIEYLSGIMQMLYAHEAAVEETHTWGVSRSRLTLSMPLRELMRGFFDELKSVSSGFASLSYTLGEMKKATVAKLEVLVADETVPAFARIVSEKRVTEEAERLVEKLHGILPKQMFVMKIQGKAFGRIIASRTLSAMKKDVTGYLYGGDITRKRKLWEKQKKGKKKMKERGTVNIPEEVFLKMMQ